MNNYAVARILQRIADLMELQGENPFKIRAYRSAASAMQSLTESLEILAEKGELKTIPGVGDAIAAKTREILETGTTGLLEKLRAGTPETLVELLRIPGLGHRRVSQLWKELGISTLAELETAAADGRLAAAGGFTEKSAAALLEKIAAFRRRRERTPIADALPYAAALALMIEKETGVRRVQVTGSLRRKRDTAGDLDLLCTAEELPEAMEACSRHPEIVELLERDHLHLRARTAAGPAVAIHFTPAATETWRLFQTTGSRAHVDAVSSLLSRPCETANAEEEIYAAAGLDFVPPELRENRGEIEAAAAGNLPLLIEAGQYRGALHAHSTWSDGSAGIAEMAQAALELGQEYLAITDHSQSLSITGGLDSDRLELQMAEVAEVNRQFEGRLRVLSGIECDILPDGSLDLPLDLLARLDWVIGSVHVQQKLPEAEQTARIVRALRTGVIDLLAHPTGRLLGYRDPYAVDLDAVMDAALEAGAAMEINAFPDRLDLNDIHARAASQRGIPISINPDAHRPRHLGMLEFGINQARRAWLTPEQVVNTWPLERLLDWISRRRSAPGAAR